MAANRLLGLLQESAFGRFDSVRDTLLVLPPPPGLAMAIVGLPGHHVIASSAPEDWVREQLTSDDLMAAMSPAFIAALSARLGRCDDGIDVLLAARGLGGRPRLKEIDPGEHPRIARALAHREEVRAFTDAGGGATLILGRGLSYRLEVAIEVSPEARNHGVATRALHDARRLVDPMDVLFAQTAPANAASLRALLGAGYTPIGAEVLFFKGSRAST